MVSYIFIICLYVDENDHDDDKDENADDDGMGPLSLGRVEKEGDHKDKNMGVE